MYIIYLVGTFPLLKFLITLIPTLNSDKNEKPCPFNSRHTHCHCHTHIMCMITEITVIDGLIFKGQGVVVIPKQRSEVLETIQSGHLRIEKLSRESLFSLYLHVF